ncbi:MAG TPA: hypothetical protein IAA10_05035 [Candidatus Blautia intestinavium]|nr:hypothetical protein [Candidatus Blautia intestinavium]
MFGAVLMDEEICRELLELVLGFRIAKVMVSKEKCFVYHPEYKGVRLDILTADGRKYRYTFDMACREDSFIKRVQTAVRNVKASREMEEQYMLLEELIKEEREHALAEGRELGLSEGRELGLTEGISRGQISSILELLSYLGEVPEEIKEAVSEENDPEVLKLYLRQAAAAKSMDDFRQFLDGRKK